MQPSRIIFLNKVPGEHIIFLALVTTFLEYLQQKGVGMDGPLIDEEQFPRNDIDVYTVRHARHRIICKYIYEIPLFKGDDYIVYWYRNYSNISDAKK